MNGICAEVRIESPATCQVAALSERRRTVSAVRRSLQAGDDGKVTEEFTVSENPDLHWVEKRDAEPVFSYGEETVYRIDRERDQGCVCELVEEAGCTVRHIEAVDGALLITFLATDLETIRTVVGNLREANEGVHIRRLTRSADQQGDRRAVLDLDVLTDRQHEVLAAAYEAGYFEHPRGASAGEVADRLDIATSTFTEHLAAAQRNLLDELVGAETTQPRVD